MKLDVTVKYFLKSLVPSIIMLLVFYFGKKDNPESIIMHYAFIGCVISSVFFPFSMRIVRKTMLTFTKEEFWQRDIFTNPIGGSLVAIFEIFCFVVSVPICIVYLMFLLIKALLNK